LRLSKQFSASHTGKGSLNLDESDLDPSLQELKTEDEEQVKQTDYQKKDGKQGTLREENPEKATSHAISRASSRNIDLSKLKDMSAPLNVKIGDRPEITMISGGVSLPIPRKNEDKLDTLIQKVERIEQMTNDIEWLKTKLSAIEKQMAMLKEEVRNSRGVEIKNKELILLTKQSPVKDFGQVTPDDLSQLIADHECFYITDDVTKIREGMEFQRTLSGGF